MIALDIIDFMTISEMKYVYKTRFHSSLSILLKHEK